MRTFLKVRLGYGHQWMDQKNLTKILCNFLFISQLFWFWNITTWQRYFLRLPKPHPYLVLSLFLYKLFPSIASPQCLNSIVVITTTWTMRILPMLVTLVFASYVEANRPTIMGDLVCRTACKKEKDEMEPGTSKVILSGMCTCFKQPLKTDCQGICKLVQKDCDPDDDGNSLSGCCDPEKIELHQDKHEEVKSCGCCPGITVGTLNRTMTEGPYCLANGCKICQQKDKECHCEKAFCQCRMVCKKVYKDGKGNAVTCHGKRRHRGHKQKRLYERKCSHCNKFPRLTFREYLARQGRCQVLEGSMPAIQ